MKTVFVFAALLAGFAFSAAARADEDIPSFQVLTCEKDCPPFTAAKALERPGVSYPAQYEGQQGIYVEAMVDIDYTIATDGGIKNAVVENLLGPQAFADAALRAVNGRKYQPAMEGPNPVEENHRVRYMFSVPDNRNPGGRSALVHAYRDGVDLAKKGKVAEGIAILRAATAKPELNFYERTMAGYALAIMDMQAGDNLAARNDVRIATINHGEFLDKKTRAGAIRLRIRLEATAGEFAESFAWFDILTDPKNDLGPVGPDDAERVMIATLHDAIAAPQPLAMPARIPKDVTPAFWQHTLLRRAFEFHAIEGKLDSFELRCQRHGIRSQVSDKANWTIPASWGGCFVNVFGAPGTTFQFVELHPAP